MKIFLEKENANKVKSNFEDTFVAEYGLFWFFAFLSGILFEGRIAVIKWFLYGILTLKDCFFFTGHGSRVRNLNGSVGCCKRAVWTPAACFRLLLRKIGFRKRRKDFFDWVSNLCPHVTPCKGYSDSLKFSKTLRNSSSKTNVIVFCENFDRCSPFQGGLRYCSAARAFARVQYTARRLAREMDNKFEPLTSLLVGPKLGTLVVLHMVC